ncbi:MAG TPA: 30S ribosomal protein S1 [bacterium]|nr:30S ribosomal protein S1 [bacterium]HOL47733.1 30S ribosomal protein S1 [bacterium]
MDYNLNESVIPLTENGSFIIDINNEAKQKIQKPIEKEVKSVSEPKKEETFISKEDEYFIDKYSKVNEIKENTIVKGKIVNIDNENIYVDVGYKSDGLIPLDSIKNKDLKKGDEIEVFVLKVDDEEGIIQLSKNKVDMLKIMEKLREAYIEKKSVVGQIIRKINGGFIVDVGIKAFLPLSQISTKKQTNFDKYINKDYEFKIIEFNEKKKNIVLSRKLLIEEKREKELQEFFDKIKVGDVVEGIVKNILPGGAFINLNCIDAFLPISEISWGRIKNINDYLKVDDKIKYIVLNIDKIEKRIKVGLKQLTKDPWTIVEEKYSINSIITGKVESITKFGVFVEIEPGLVGLIPLSEISWSEIDLKNISEIIKKDETVKCKILNIDKSKKRITLSLKKVLPDPWEIFKNKYKVGDIISGTIININNYGLVVKITDGVEGFIDKNNISWEKNKDNILNSYNIGETINLKILEINSENKKLELGIKQLTVDPWCQKIEKYKIGDIVKVTVSAILNIGLIVKLPNGVDGLIHKSQIPKEKSIDLNKHFKLNEELEAEIININSEKHKLGLSITKYLETIEKRELEDYLKNQEIGETTLGSLINLEALFKK